MSSEWCTHVSRQQVVHCKGSTLSFIVGTQHDENIFDSHDEDDGPNNER
jgi:hypothetical protein